MAAADLSTAVAILDPNSEAFLEATAGYKPIAMALWGQAICNCTTCFTSKTSSKPKLLYSVSPHGVRQQVSIRNRYKHTASALKHLKNI